MLWSKSNARSAADALRSHPRSTISRQSQTFCVAELNPDAMCFAQVRIMRQALLSLTLRNFWKEDAKGGRVVVSISMKLHFDDITKNVSSKASKICLVTESWRSSAARADGISTCWRTLRNQRYGFGLSKASRWIAGHTGPFHALDSHAEAHPSNTSGRPAAAFTRQCRAHVPHRPVRHTG